MIRTGNEFSHDKLPTTRCDFIRHTQQHTSNKVINSTKKLTNNFELSSDKQQTIDEAAWEESRLGLQRQSSVEKDAFLDRLAAYRTLVHPVAAHLASAVAAQEYHVLETIHAHRTARLRKVPQSYQTIGCHQARTRCFLHVKEVEAKDWDERCV